ncbi:MAG: hypothetical protein LBH18_04420 [Spirochaetaceae bacterium]|nr:hypothetical protein [Spirochaetaceae bacterium]
MTRGRLALPLSLRVVLVIASPRRGRSNPANYQAAARNDEGAAASVMRVVLMQQTVLLYI